MGGLWIDAALLFQPPAGYNHSCSKYLLLDDQPFLTSFCECLISFHFLLVLIVKKALGHYRFFFLIKFDLLFLCYLKDKHVLSLFYCSDMLKTIRPSLFYCSSSLYPPTFTFLDSIVLVLLFGLYSFPFWHAFEQNKSSNDKCLSTWHMYTEYIVNYMVTMLCFVDQDCDVFHRWRRLQLFMGPRHRLRPYGQGHCAQQISSEINFLPTRMVQMV